MDCRKKFLKLHDKNNKNSRKEKNIITLDKEEKSKNDNKNDNSYIHKMLQNSNKTPKAGAISLSSYNESYLPSFKISIRDILSTEDNKQKAINYVIQKRNEEKYGKKNVINNKDENNSINKNNYNNLKNLIKNNTDFIAKRNANNLNQNTNSINNNIYTNKPVYQYYLEKKTKPYISTKLKTENNFFQDSYNLNYQNSLAHNYMNNSLNKIKGNNATRRQIISTQINNNNISHDKISIYSSYNNTNNNTNINFNDKNNKNVKMNQIRSNNTSKDYSSIERIPRETKIIPIRPKHVHLTSEQIKNQNMQINVVNKNEKQNGIKKSYDLLPFNRNKNGSIYYTRYSKKNDSKSIENESQYIPQKIMFKDLKKFKIINNSMQLITKKDNNLLRNDRIQKNKEKTIEIDISHNNLNINNKDTNSELTKKSNINQNNIKNGNLLFKNEDELIEFINKNYNQEKKNILFNLEGNNNELEKINNQLNKEIVNKNKEKENNKFSFNSDIDTLNLEKEQLIKENQNLKKELEKIKSNKNIKNDNLNELQNKYDEQFKEKEKIKKNYDKLKKDYNNIVKEREAEKLNKNNIKGNKQLNKIQKEYKELLDEKNELMEENKIIINDNDKLKEQLNSIKKEYDEIKKRLYISESNTNNNIIKIENDNLKNEIEKLKKENNKIQNDLVNKNIKNDKDNQEYIQIKEKYDNLLKNNEKLKEEKKLLHQEYKTIRDDYTKIGDDYKNLKEDYNKLKEEYNELKNLFSNSSNKQSIEIKKNKKLISKNKSINKEKDELSEKKNENIQQSKNYIKKKSKSVNDVINKINNSISNTNVNSNKGNKISTIISNENDTKLINEKNKINEEKKYSRLSKALLCAKKNQKNKNSDTDGSINKSEKVSNLVKKFEENTPQRDNYVYENNSVVEQCTITKKFIDKIENQNLNQSNKKKKNLKKSFDGNE